MEVGELWVGLDKESFIQSFRKKVWDGRSWEFSSWHLSTFVRRTEDVEIVMDGFGNGSFGTGEGESWGARAGVEGR